MLHSDRLPLIHEMIEAQALRTPHLTAAAFRDSSLSYRELIDEVNELAKRLVSAGIGPEAIVAVCLDRSLEMLIALIAVLKAGGAYLPLDPAFPAERIAFMVDDSRAMAVITDTAKLKCFSGQAISAILIDGPPPTLATGTVSKSPKLEPGNLAYLMYTSGSTGKPKGVMVEHGNVANFFAGMDEVIGVEPGTWLAVTSISFDISVLELLWTLARGFTVVIQDDEDKLLASGQYSIGEQIRRHRVTHLQCTPTLAASLVRQAPARAALRQLHKLLVGGEALPVTLAERLLEATDGDLINMYGPTETTIWSTTAPVTRGAPITIGRPIVNTPIYLIGEDGRPCASGEICIGGAGVARGYWRRPELTAERFVALNAVDGVTGRVYKTGDRGRYLLDGTIEFLGRIDNQIKLRGYRVEPGEIEAALMEHPTVARAVVTSFRRAGDDQLAAYVVTETGCAATREELRTLLANRLPAYMIPVAWVFLDELPTTPNGKLDRKALPVPSLAPEAIPEIPGAATHLEKAIATVIGEALSLATVGLKQNFFDLGATSLIVAETAVTLRESLGRPVKITDLFAHPTVSALAAFLDGRDSSEEGFRDAAQRGAARRAARQTRRFAS